jgi:hypothetical protein
VRAELLRRVEVERPLLLHELCDTDLGPICKMFVKNGNLYSFCGMFKGKFDQSIGYQHKRQFLARRW